MSWGRRSRRRPGPRRRHDRQNRQAGGPEPRPGILEIAPYIGGEAKISGNRNPIRLASNESALGPSLKAIAAYKAMAGEIHRYPEGGCAALREALGKMHGIEPSRIVCGAGSDELIGLLTRAYAGPGDEVLYGRHGFLMYPIAALSAGATPVAVPEKDLTFDVGATLKRVGPKTKIVFIANPNNPTGTYIPMAAMQHLQAGLPPSVLLVIDAAYAEFVSRNDYEPGTELVNRSRNVVMTRTFSKIYALAALRLGWAYCSAEIADVLNRVRILSTSTPRPRRRGWPRSRTRKRSSARANTTASGAPGSKRRSNRPGSRFRPASPISRWCVSGRTPRALTRRCPSSRRAASSPAAWPPINCRTGFASPSAPKAR